MPKIVPILLWLMVGVMLCVLLYMRANSAANPSHVAQTNQVQNPDDPPGAAFSEVPWKNFPDVPPFKLTDQDDQKFDSRSLAGKPYLVSFFYATCPDICRKLNAQIRQLNDQLKNVDVAFVSLTVDPAHDTPEVLHRYAQDYNANPPRWVFLTGQPFEIKQLGEQVFGVEVNKATHTDDILLVDKWGRYRDRFKWSDPRDMKRLLKVVKAVAAETEPPLDATVHTRNVLAGQKSLNFKKVPWIRDFHLTDQHGEPFYSRQLTGEVWIANFFFVSCPGICKRQMAYLRGLRERMGEDTPMIVSITTDPDHDTPGVLSKYADQLDAVNNWEFCTGPDLLIRRLSSEFFGTHNTSGHHTSMLFVVDRWHRVRGTFDWQKPEEELAMQKLIKQLRAETEPTPIPDKPRPELEPEFDDEPAAGAEK